MLAKKKKSVNRGCFLWGSCTGKLPLVVSRSSVESLLCLTWSHINQDFCINTSAADWGTARELTLGTLLSGLTLTCSWSAASLCFLWTCVSTSPSNNLVIGQFSSAVRSATLSENPDGLAHFWLSSFLFFPNSGFRKDFEDDDERLDFMFSVISIPTGSSFTSVDDLLTSCDGRRSVASSSSLFLFRFTAGRRRPQYRHLSSARKICLVFKQQVHSTATHTSP